MLDNLRQDLRQTARSLRRSPGFTFAAIIVIALGVGATTAAFTLTDYVLIRPLPFPDSDRLVKIWQGPPDRPAHLRGLAGTNDVSRALYLGWKQRTTSFSTMGAYATASSNLTGSGDPERLDGAVVTYDTLPTIGIPPAIGRALTPDDDKPNAPCVILISDRLWQRNFGAERSTLGRRVRLDDESCEIIGVMPARFDFPSRTTQFWRPIRFAADAATDFDDRFLRIIAKRRTDATFEAAAADLSRASIDLAKASSSDRADVSAVMIDLRDEINDQSRTLLFALAGAAGCLLLIACTNLASLTIARASTRSRDLAVRVALGAGRSRLVRELLTESVALAVAGGGIGVLIAVAAIPAIVRLVPTALPIAETPSVDWRMLAIAAATTLGTAVGFGVMPALRASRAAAGTTMREDGRAGSSRRSTRLRGALVVTQVAASIVLVVGSGLLIRALIRVQSTPAGFASDGVLTMRTFLPWSKYGLQAKRTDFYRQVLGEVERLPGVTRAAYTSYLPMTFRGGVWDVVIAGRPVDPRRAETASSRFVTPHYFEAMSIPRVAGRAFDDSDGPQSQPVAIVSESFVRSYLDGRDAIGRTFRFGFAGDRTIVGVVGEVRVRGLERRSEPQVYLPYQQQGDGQTMGYTPKDLVIRLDADHADRDAINAIAPAVRRVIAAVDPDQPISDLQPLSAILEGETVTRVVQVRVLGGFAMLSCLLAAIGLHGLLAFVVSSRTREFGVRLALGAQPAQILSMVAGRGVALGAAGIVIGLVAAFAVAAWLQSVLAGVSPADPWTMVIAVVISLALCIGGSVVPAIRAARTDPRAALQ